jgi:hypothetical protein
MFVSDRTGGSEERFAAEGQTEGERTGEITDPQA